MIVEKSRKDPFWGCIQNGNVFDGENHLGRLLSLTPFLLPKYTKIGPCFADLMRILIFLEGVTPRTCGTDPLLPLILWYKDFQCCRVDVSRAIRSSDRHALLSSTADANYPITVIQALLRHKNANTTAKYLHKLRGIKNALDDAL
jgi:hypothetical protein